MTMTPQERVLATLNHQQPDRVPIDFGGHRSSGIAAIAYRKLREALDLPERPIRIYDPVPQLAIIAGFLPVPGHQPDERTNRNND